MQVRVKGKSTKLLYNSPGFLCKTFTLVKKSWCMSESPKIETNTGLNAYAALYFVVFAKKSSILSQLNYHVDYCKLYGKLLRN